MTKIPYAFDAGRLVYVMVYTDIIYTIEKVRKHFINPSKKYW